MTVSVSRDDAKNGSGARAAVAFYSCECRRTYTKKVTGKGRRLNDSTLSETNANSFGGTPRNMTAPFRLFLIKKKSEIIGNADGTFDVESGSGLREIANDAVDPGTAAKRD